MTLIAHGTPALILLESFVAYPRWRVISQDNLIGHPRSYIGFTVFQILHMSPGKPTCTHSRHLGSHGHGLCGRSFSPARQGSGLEPLLRLGNLYQPFRMAQRCRLSFLGSVSVSQGTLNVSKLEKDMNMYKRPRTASTFLYTMIITRDFLVSDPRDRIVAVMGLVNEKPSKDFHPFRADYMVSVETFYHQFGVHLVDNGLAQTLLNLVGLHRGTETPMDIPSSVPGWTAQGRDIASQQLCLGGQVTKLLGPVLLAIMWLHQDQELRLMSWSSWVIALIP